MDARQLEPPGMEACPARTAPQARCPRTSPALLLATLLRPLTVMVLPVSPYTPPPLCTRRPRASVPGRAPRVPRPSHSLWVVGAPTAAQALVSPTCASLPYLCVGMILS